MRLPALLVVVALSGCQKPGAVCGGEPPAYVPGPDFACTLQLRGSMVCPRGQVGWGYQCTDTQCWELFMDGPCAPSFTPADAGPPDAGGDGGACAAVDACPSEGAQQCRGSTQLECRQGCWSVVGTCGFDGSVFCSPSPAPVVPNGDCTASIAGAMVCPAPGIGYGYACMDAGCWQFFFDGPCVSPGDAGPFCSGTPRSCTDEGRFECRGGLSSTCSAGCWVDTGVCSPDAGLLCGPSFGLPPSAQCTPANVGTSVCPEGPSSGYGYTCTARGCWDGFLDGPCAYFDAGVRDGN